VTDLLHTSLGQPFTGFSDPVADALESLKEFNYSHIYKNPRIKAHLASVEDMFTWLFDIFLSDLKAGNRQSPVFSGFLDGLSSSYSDNHSHAEIVRDYISGMTDSHFISLAPASLRPDYIDNV
jgi:dGTPase